MGPQATIAAAFPILMLRTYGGSRKVVLGTPGGIRTPDPLLSLPLLVSQALFGCGLDCIFTYLRCGAYSL
jgi:hypothetical protein